MLRVSTKVEKAKDRAEGEGIKGGFGIWGKDLSLI
jgi:hypothetical protein